MEKDVYLNEFFQLPSITGKDVIDLEEYAKLPRTKSYEAVKAFLEEARKSKKDICVRFIVAEWGEGKTSICEGLLKKIEVIKSDLVIPISTKRLIVHIKEKSSLFSDTASLGARFFACLLYALKDVIENELAPILPFDEIRIKPKSQQSSTIDFIKDGLKSILNVLNSDSRIFIFLDEFEDIVDETKEIRDFIRAGLVEVLNGSPRCLIEEPFAGRLHMIISATPPAYEKFVSEIPADARRLFGQRALKIELEKLDRKSAYQYILGVLKYCWNGKLPKIPFRESGLFNAIYISTLGNPRSIINLLKILLTHAKINAPEGKIRYIQPKDFIHALLDQSIEVYGGEVHLIDKNIFNRLRERLEDKCRRFNLDFNKCMNLTYLLLSNISPLSIREIGQRLGEDPSSYISVIGSCFQELWGIERPFIYFKKVIEGADEVYSRASSSEKISNIDKIISALEFYEFDQKDLSLLSVLYVPYQQLSKLAYEDRLLFQNYIDFFTTFSPELRDENEIIVLVDKHMFDKVKKSEENYVMLSQAAINLFYPSPSFFFLDFIEDLDERFKIGVQLTRHLTSFEKEFKEGIMHLITEGGRDRGIEVKRIFETHGTFKDVEVIKLSYSEPLQRYEIRTHILSPLRISVDEFHEQIRATVNEMKESYVPLLLVFSWNPLPLEAKSILDTFFGPERGFEKVFYYLEFPLTEFQCHQIIGYILARENKYKIREERWKARASRILDEIKFESILKDFIRNGITAGYTLRQLILKELKSDDVPGLLRSLLITEGSIENRWNKIDFLEKKFKIYGKEFPICPKDIESITQFKKYIDELKDNELIIEKDEILEINDVAIERRILSILREYNRTLSKNEIDNLFISVISSGISFSTDIYLRILKEKRKISFDEKTEVYSLYDTSTLDRQFRELKERVKNFKSQYFNFPYGFLASIKQRNVSTIIIRDCINSIEELIESIEKIALAPDHKEKRVRNQILLEVLMRQLEEVIELFRRFYYKEYSPRYSNFKNEIKSIEFSLEKLEEEINNLHITDKKLRIKEREEINKRLAEIEEIEKKNYTADEVKELALKLQGLLLSQPKEVYGVYKNCPVFDVKMIQMMNEIESIMRIASNYNERIKNIESEIRNIRELKDSISCHEIFTSQYKHPFSSVLQNWVKCSIERKEET